METSLLHIDIVWKLQKSKKKNVGKENEPKVSVIYLVYRYRTGIKLDYGIILMMLSYRT